MHSQAADARKLKMVHHCDHCAVPHTQLLGPSALKWRHLSVHPSSEEELQLPARPLARVSLLSPSHAGPAAASAAPAAATSSPSSPSSCCEALPPTPPISRSAWSISTATCKQRQHRQTHQQQRVHEGSPESMASKACAKPPSQPAARLTGNPPLLELSAAEDEAACTTPQLCVCSTNAPHLCPLLHHLPAPPEHAMPHPARQPQVQVIHAEQLLCCLHLGRACGWLLHWRRHELRRDALLLCKQSGECEQRLQGGRHAACRG
ncbi:hypothetical protein COO60DRAFT_93202 [Scenedesmus sp. NREL 46B-D3]|nr:hypothetical protein COO60DRAFT_93202 [Scenedesmus sp. NREL 46B-D3]